MLKPLSITAVAVLALAACSGPETELDGNFDVGGTDPASWTVKVDRTAGKSIISIIGEPTFEGSVPTIARGEGGAFLVTSTTPSGDFAMNFTHKECYDGLAESPRPWTVTVDWNGETLLGCALPTPPAAG